ncbi:hypothetical protein UFOVP1419_43 [uncultured Caudovirales phage]|uniref:Uncharacterized protein n=1 Tax=uncultured Caudovirales phage TaxID=2100421 RepID=A0A6J5SE84_9CAUD|nr:hypothetical protein UFOVP1419_43 [uncultured Caudovirales phage]
MIEGVKELYLEITEFCAGCGGTYTNMDTATYRDLLDALFDGRYRITRDDAGQIVTVSTWWLIHPDDIELVRQGGRPHDISSGSVVYVADHCGGGLPGLIRFIREEIGRRGVCWHHKYKSPGRFRYYPEKRGYNV